MIHSDKDNFTDYDFTVCGKESSPCKSIMSLQDFRRKGYVYLWGKFLICFSAPTILQKIEHCLAIENISDSVLEQMLLCLKEEWME